MANCESKITNICIGDVSHVIREDTRVYLSDYVSSNNSISQAIFLKACQDATGKTLVITPYITSDGVIGSWIFSSATFDVSSVNDLHIVGTGGAKITFSTNTSFKIADGFTLSNIKVLKVASLESGFMMNEGATAHFNNVTCVPTGTSTDVSYGIALNTSGAVYLDGCSGLFAVNTGTDETTRANCVAYYNNCTTPASTVRIGLGCTNYIKNCILPNTSYYGTIYCTNCVCLGVRTFTGNIQTSTWSPPTMRFVGCDITGVGSVNFGESGNTVFVGCNIGHAGTPAYSISSGYTAIFEGCKIAGKASDLSGKTGVTLGHCLFDDGVYPS